MIATSELEGLVAAYLGGVIRVEDLDGTVARLGEHPEQMPADMADLWATLELRLAEYTSGDLDEPELQGALVSLTPISVPRQPGTFTVIVSTGTSAGRANRPVEWRQSPAVRKRLAGAHG